MYRKDGCAYLMQGSLRIQLQVKYIQVTCNVYVSTKDYIIHDTITRWDISWYYTMLSLQRDPSSDD